MTLLLTILSVVAGLALLSTLILGLLFVLKPLESVRRSLRQIAMGVRAIEHQAIGLGERASALETDLARAADRSASVAGRLAATGKGGS